MRESYEITGLALAEMEQAKHLHVHTKYYVYIIYVMRTIMKTTSKAIQGWISSVEYTTCMYVLLNASFLSNIHVEQIPLLVGF